MDHGLTSLIAKHPSDSSALQDQHAAAAASATSVATAASWVGGVVLATAMGGKCWGCWAVDHCAK